MARAKRSDLIKIIRQLRQAVVIEASGGEGEENIDEIPRILQRADDILRRETEPKPQ